MFMVITQIYKMDVVSNIMRLSEDDICCQLKRICRMADQSARSTDDAIGILTTQSRDEWAKCRQLLLQGNYPRWGQSSLKYYM